MSERFPTARSAIEPTGQRQAKMWGRRIALALLVVLIVLAVVGLLGPRTAQESVAGADGRLSMTYDAITRPGADTEIAVTLSPHQPADTYRVAISRSTLSDLGIETIFPEPVEQTSIGSRVVFEFAGSGSGSMDIAFSGRTPTAHGPGSSSWSATWLASGGPITLEVRTVMMP